MRCVDTRTETRHPETTVTLTPEQVTGLADRTRPGVTARPDRVPLPNAGRAVSATTTETCGLTPCETCPAARAACCRAASKVGRAILLTVGVLSVATGAVGVVVPGLPT